MRFRNLLAVTVYGRRRRDIIKYRNDELPANYMPSGDLEEFFLSKQGPIAHKWLHFFPIYERYFKKYRCSEVRFLEIGVSKGGSLGSGLTTRT